MKLAIFIFTSIIGIYIGLFLLLFIFQRSFIYYPSTGKISPIDYGLPELDSVELITEDGISLTSWYKPPSNPSKLTILYFHGNAGHIGHRALKVKPFLNYGYGLLLLSYRGYGPNNGKPTESNLYLDGKAAFNFLIEQNIPIQKLVFYGESLGTGVAVELAQNKAIAALVLEAPFTSLLEIAKHHFPFFPTTLILKDKYTSVSKVGNLKTHLLVLHGRKDRTIPLKFGQKLFNMAEVDKQLYEFPDAGHNNIYSYNAPSKIIRFLAPL